LTKDLKILNDIFDSLIEREGLVEGVLSGDIVALVTLR
jgi:hypothetical protein